MVQIQRSIFCGIALYIFEILGRWGCQGCWGFSTLAYLCRRPLGGRLRNISLILVDIKPNIPRTQRLFYPSGITFFFFSKCAQHNTTQSYQVMARNATVLLSASEHRESLQYGAQMGLIRFEGIGAEMLSGWMRVWYIWVTERNNLARGGFERWG
ncbi:hypothetical protein BCR34DRAFT_197130 [Clohesyomyces aquaticus]|uniref:Uncharacterized protein n=1 Tax=Clohesyomyces aquaticus TaxID=1231657 RepID=A0A1Y1ZXT7_9PLEO|nr:hypothetical protein BCR34DRAFT_197130 [Clohesyomyces aquaticus]